MKPDLQIAAVCGGLALVFSCCSASVLRPTAAPRVTVLNGTFEGLHNPSFDQDFFLGMRFAKPPVGDLRYRPAEPLDTFDGVVAAKEYSPFCVGYGSDTDGHVQSEDCLTINVVKPAKIKRGELLPVAVWIYGGGLTNGGSSRPNYNLSNIVRVSSDYKTPIVGVSINYRVAGLGFLSSHDIIDQKVANLGLRDQRFALQWIQDNIAAFGGDLKKVTIWGESAGGLSVGAHTVGFGGNAGGLFRGAIAESGGPFWYGSHRNASFYQPFFDTLVSSVGCTGASDKVACLRTVPLEALNVTLREQQSIWSFPSIDGVVYHELASVSLNAGKFAKVPLLIGSNSDEGASFGPKGINTTQQLRDYITSSNSPTILSKATVDRILELYPNDPEHDVPLPLVLPNPPGELGARFKQAATYVGDEMMIASRRASCEFWAANDVPAFCYQFDTKPPTTPPEVGVAHFTEVAWVFDNTKGLGYDPSPFLDAPPRYFELSLEMSRRWIGFVVDGNPNVRGFPEWPDYRNGARQIRFAGNVSRSIIEKDNYRAAGMRFIKDKALEYNR